MFHTRPRHDSLLRTLSSPSPRRVRIGLAVAVLATVLITALLSIAPAQSAETFTFNGAGWGHGVGMSQYGARNRANDGATAADILSSYYPGTELAAYAAPETLRVHLGDVYSSDLSTLGSIEISQGDNVLGTYGPGVETRIELRGGDIAIGDTIATATQENPVEISFDEPVLLGAFGHRYYFGKLRIWPVDGKARIVEFGMSMESYIKGIAEMPSSWPSEALKAQAVAARTYANYVTDARRSDPEWNRGYDISATTLDQNYEGYDAAVSAWTAAVEATTDLQLLFEGRPIKAYYASSNGGATETASVVFGISLPYTVAKEDPYDSADNSWSEWSRTYTADQLSTWLNGVSESAVGTVQSIEFAAPTAASKRMDNAEVTITGTDGTKTITGRRFMVIVNAGVFANGGTLSEHLPSTRMVLDEDLSPGLLSASGSFVEGHASSDESTDPPEGVAPTIMTPVEFAESEASTKLTPRVSASIDTFSFRDGRLKITGTANANNETAEAVEVRLAIDNIVVSEVPAADGAYTSEVSIPVDGRLREVCVHAHEVGSADSTPGGCRTIRATETDEGSTSSVAISASSSASPNG